MASLEPPARSYVAMDGTSQANSASTSMTQFDTAQGANSPRSGDTQPIESVLHEPKQVSSPMGEKAEDLDNTPAQTHVPQTPQVYLTFLVISGKRRTMCFEPGTTVGRLKELVWNSWPSDWEDERPTAPSFLRVLYLGRMLQDDETLSQMNFPTYTPQTNSAPTPTIVHLSIRPFATQNEPDIKKKRKNRPSDAPQNEAGGQDDEPQSAGCCGCVIC